MAVIVGTNSYGDEDGLAGYASMRGNTISGDSSQLLIKAMDYIEYSHSYIGEKYDYDQSLMSPRSVTVYDLGDDDGVVPYRVILAQYEAAMLIDSGENLTGVIERKTIKEKVSSIEVEYSESSSSKNTTPYLSLLLKPYIAHGGAMVTYR